MIMTGISLPWRMTPKQWKSFKEYCKKPVSAMLIGGGACLMLEHLFEYGGFDLLDIAGHETYGLLMMWKELKLYRLKNIIR